MTAKKDILNSIRNTVESVEPSAVIILYGSFAREDDKKNSDLDLLILLDKEDISRGDKKRIKYPLYDIEFETGQIISPLVLSKHDWEQKHKITPFYKNIVNEGVIL